MCKISDLLCFFILIVVSVRDVQIRKVSVPLLVVTGFLSLIYQMTTREMDWKLILGGAAVGVIFLLVSKVTREGFGYGDSIGIGILGIFLGFFRVLTVLSIAFFLLLCMSIPILWSKRMSKKYALPFFPFLTAGYLCLLWMEGMSS